MQSRMIELGNTDTLSPAMDAPAVRARITKDATDAGSQGIGLIRRLVIVNLGLVGLQALSAGFFLSGYGWAAAAHADVALALQLGVLIQAVTAVVLWRRRRLPAGVAGFSIGLIAIVFLQAGLGYSKSFWLHVPIGVGIFGGLIRQVTSLGTLLRTTGVQSE